MSKKKNKEAVDSKLYSKKYYMTINEGGKIFNKGKGRQLSTRLRRHYNLAFIKKGNKVLDIGCGRGEIVAQTAIDGAQGIGIDYSSDSIKICNEIKKTFKPEIRKRMKFTKADSKKLQFPANSIDKVFMLDVVEHLYDWELKIVYKKIRKFLKKDGILIVHTTPNTDFYKYGYPIVRIVYPILRPFSSKIVELINTKPNWRNRKFLPKDPEEGQEYNKEGHINEQNPRTLKKMLEDAGFKVEIKLVPFTRHVDSWGIRAIYRLLSFPFIKKIFSAEITAICKK